MVQHISMLLQSLQRQADQDNVLLEKARAREVRGCADRQMYVPAQNADHEAAGGGDRAGSGYQDYLHFYLRDVVRQRFHTMHEGLLRVLVT
jgi:hypothetical protein